MNQKEIENTAKSLLKRGYTAQQIWEFASKQLEKEELEKLWSIPRHNITNFVLDCFNRFDLKSPFLDIGCGRRSYRPEAMTKFGKNIVYISLDHYLPSGVADPLRLPNLLASVTSLPFPSLSIATIICTEVLEHINEDWRALQEISRVLKKEGILILTLPGKDIPKHEKLPYQIDYRRYTPDQVRSLLTTHRLHVLSLETKVLFADLEINILVLAQKR